MSLVLGSPLGSYQVTAKIGEGGMGEVYQARDTKLDRDVALKVLPEAFTSDPDRLARFEREAKVLASLNHPNIGSIYGLEEAEGVKALVLELIEGPTLADRIKQGPIPVDEALPIAKQIAEALEAAHEQGVIHRDLKPANVKVKGDGTVKVLDFGLAKSFGPDKGGATDESPTVTAVDTRFGEVLGTAAYMSPEQARGESLDAQTDIWSMGCLVLEMLTAQPPFHGSTVSETLAAVLRDEPDWNTLGQQLPSRVAELLKRCLRKTRRRRLHHVADVRIEVEDAIEEGPAAAAISHHQTASARRPPVVQQLTANPTDIPVSGAAISPDGVYLAFADRTGLFLRVIETGETSRVDLSEALQFAELSWLPDGTRLMATGWSSLTDTVSLYSVSILGGAPRKLRPGWRAAVSPDGAEVCFLSHEWPVRVIWIMGTDGRNPRELVAAQEGEQFFQVCWSPTGQRVAYGLVAADGTIAIKTVDIRGTRHTTLIADPVLLQNWRGILPFEWLSDGRLLFSRRDRSPNQFSSRLWAVSADPETGVSSGAPVEVIGWTGFNVRDIRATRDGTGASVLVERSPPSVFVAQLDDRPVLGPPRRVTLDDRHDYPSAWTSDGRTVLFESNRGGRFDLFGQNLDSPVANALVTGVQHKMNAEISPDGHWLLYQDSSDLMIPSGVWRAPLANGRVTGPSEQVLEDENVELRCGSTRCVLSESEGDDLVFREFDAISGRGPELMRSTLKFADSRFAHWALSRDERRVALVNFGSAIQILDLSERSNVVLTLQEWTALEFVDWATDGESVVVVGFAANGPRLNNSALLHVRLNGEVTVLRHEPNEWHVKPVSSPDGRHLAFATMTMDSNAWMVQGI